MIHTYSCLACGYKGLKEPPYDEMRNSSFEICSCCGFQFGLDDDDENGVCRKEHLYKCYSDDWIMNGFMPFSENYPTLLQTKYGFVKVSVLKKQLKEIGVEFNE